MNAILDAYNRKGTIYICGNGGSASTASHFQNDFNKGIRLDLSLIPVPFLSEYSKWSFSSFTMYKAKTIEKSPLGLGKEEPTANLGSIESLVII